MSFTEFVIFFLSLSAICIGIISWLSSAIDFSVEKKEERSFRKMVLKSLVFYIVIFIGALGMWSLFPNG